MEPADLGQVGPYRLVRELGRGGMGVVYEAHHPSFDRPLAVKRLLADQAAEVERVRFLREAELLARVRHPNIVTVHDLGTAPNGDPYLVTDLVPGEALDSILRHGPLEPLRAAALVADLAGAVEAIHAVGILHRDLKPANVIVRPDGSPVLLDFGLARELAGERLTQTGEVMGTPAYMSPEQANGVTSGLDRRCDVYGLGGVLYSALCGELPFEGASFVEVLSKLLKHDPAWPRALRPEVPESLDAIVRCAMQKVPRGRYESAGALAEELRRVLGGEAPLALASAPGPRRGLRVLAGALLLLLAAGGGLAAWSVVYDQAPSPTPSPSAAPTAAPSATPSLAPLPGGQLACGVLSDGEGTGTGDTWAWFLGGEPRYAAAVNQEERVLRAWRVDVAPPVPAPALTLPSSGGRELRFARADPVGPRLAVVERLRGVKERYWAAVYALGGAGWSRAWEVEVEELHPLPGAVDEELMRHRLDFSPDGQRLAVVMPHGVVRILDASSGEVQTTLIAPHERREYELDGERGTCNRRPSSFGALRFAGPRLVIGILDTSVRFGTPKEPDPEYLGCVVWDLDDPTLTPRLIQAPNQAGTALAVWGEEVALGFQQHRVATGKLAAAELGADLPVDETLRRYSDVPGARAGSLNYPARWLEYAAQGQVIVAGAGDTKYQVDGGELRWWRRADQPGQSAWRLEGVMLSIGGVPAGKRQINTFQLDPGERYVLLGRRAGRVELLEWVSDRGWR